jgi:hypothetical protein
VFERFCLASLLCTVLTVEAETTSALRDPTRPSGWRAAEEAREIGGRQPSALELQAVFSHAGNRTAMISGRRVTEGDQIGDARVIRIEASTVILDIAGRPVELAAVTAPVKSPTTETEVLP